MRSIIILLFVLVTYRVLIGMESLTIEPSNSALEVCFFISNIDHNTETPKKILTTDTKKKLLAVYIASTNTEQLASEKYNKLINSSDYMLLNKRNKRTIQSFFANEHTYNAVYCNKGRFVGFPSFPRTQEHYLEVLKLPQKVRTQMAKSYSSMILIQALTQQEIDKKTIGQTILSAGITFATTGSLDFFLWGIPIFTPIIAFIPELLFLPKSFYDEIMNPLTWLLKDRELLPLVPEDMEI